MVDWGKGVPLTFVTEHFRQSPEAKGYGYNITESLSSNVDDKTLHELYVWPFADAVRAGVGSVMCVPLESLLKIAMTDFYSGAHTIRSITAMGVKTPSCSTIS